VIVYSNLVCRECRECREFGESFERKVRTYECVFIFDFAVKTLSKPSTLSTPSTFGFVLNL
jgi:hypothetical protein